MSVRLLLSDEVWNELKLVLNEIKRKDGRPPVISDRLFIEAVLYIARTGIPYRDLPADFGNWSAIYNRLRRFQNNGTWEKLWKRLQNDELSLAENLFIDSTCVRAHQHAAGAPKKKGGQSQQALGRSSGGFSTKIHLGCLDETHTISIAITAGQVPDVKGFDPVFMKLPQDNSIKNGIMDKGYDSDNIRQQLTDLEIQPVIPPKKNRVIQIPYDAELYKERNRIERFINRMKQFRRIATRYEKLAETFMAFLHIVASYVAILQFVNTP